jgi:hypothetical protein
MDRLPGITRRVVAATRQVSLECLRSKAGAIAGRHAVTLLHGESAGFPANPATRGNGLHRGCHESEAGGWGLGAGAWGLGTSRAYPGEYELLPLQRSANQFVRNFLNNTRLVGVALRVPDPW